MIQDKVNDAPADGSSAPPSETPPATPPGETPPAANEETGPKFDDYGYEIPSDKKAGNEGKATGEKAPVEEKLEDLKDPATGYGAKPIEEPKEEKKPDDPPATPDPNKPADPPPVEIDVKGLDEKEAAKIKDFAKENKLTPEVAQKLADMKKSEIQSTTTAQVAAQKQFELNTARQRASWDKELRNDPTFGGDKFHKNTVKVEKVLSEFMPATKKVLTEGKIMLNPNVMRDLAKLADVLYNPDKFVMGEAGTVLDKKVEDDKPSDPLDFYK
jgi:hypothetical protein